jgi:putative ABC transport system substrate-binding protein
LPERGWLVGRNLIVDMRYTQGDPQRAEALARELVQQGVKVIVTNFTATAMAAQRATSVTPIVMLSSGFPVEGGLVDSLARPGGNVTGMAIYAGGGAIFGKFVQLLREMVCGSGKPARKAISRPRSPPRTAYLSTRSSSQQA